MSFLNRNVKYLLLYFTVSDSKRAVGRTNEPSHIFSEFLLRREKNAGKSLRRNLKTKIEGVKEGDRGAREEVKTE